MDNALENLGPYPTTDEIYLAAIEDGYTPAAAEAYANELMALLERDWAIQQEGEIAAENAWLIAAENAGWQETELEREYERSLGVVPFSEAYADALDDEADKMLLAEDEQMLRHEQA